MNRRIWTLVLSIFLLVSQLSGVVYGEEFKKNPSREELEKKIEAVARKRGIPSVILKSIARVESVFQQYNSDGSVFTGRSGSIGLMQIYNAYGWFDTNRLKYDIDYNIEAGAQVLLMKWQTANEKLPQIGDMNPNVLENWYFALWAYNGWSESNNPNMIPYKFNTWTKKQAFQDLVYMVAEKDYGQVITPIDSKLLPKSGLPSKDAKFDTPEIHHFGDIEMYSPGEIVKADVSKTLSIRKSPSGESIGSFENGTLLEVLEEPQLNDGYFWYKVREQEGTREGWVSGSWIANLSDSEAMAVVDPAIKEKYPLNDIWTSPAREEILALYDLDVITGDTMGNFYPEKTVTREELSIFIGKALNLEGDDYELTYEDSDEIEPWAVEYVKAVSKAGLIGGFGDNTFRPKEPITREQIAVLFSRIFEVDKPFMDIEFADAKDISPWALNAAKVAVNSGIMDPKGENMFMPKDLVTREELMKELWTAIQFLTYVL